MTTPKEPLPYRIQFSQGDEYDIVSDTSRTPRRWPKREAESICQWLNEAYSEGRQDSRAPAAGSVRDIIGKVLVAIDDGNTTIAKHLLIEAMNAEVPAAGVAVAVEQAVEQAKERVTAAAMENYMTGDFIGSNTCFTELSDALTALAAARAKEVK